MGGREGEGECFEAELTSSRGLTQVEITLESHDRHAIAVVDFVAVADLLIFCCTKYSQWVMLKHLDSH